MGFGDWVCVHPAPGAGRRARAAIESARSNSRRVVNGCITVGVCVTINSYYRRSQGDGGAIRARAAAPSVSRRLLLLGALLQERDQVGAIFRLLETGEDHLRARNVLFRVQQVIVQRLFAPSHALVLVRRRVRETLRGAGDASEQTAEVRTLRARPDRSRVSHDDISPSHLARFHSPLATLERRETRRRRRRTCLCPPPFSATWHCAHFVLKIFAPARASRDVRSNARSSVSLVRALALSRPSARRVTLARGSHRSSFVIARPRASRASDASRLDRAPRTSVVKKRARAHPWRRPRPGPR